MGRGQLIFTCLKDFSHCLRKFGAHGICIRMNCFDALLYGPMMRLVRGWYAKKLMGKINTEGVIAADDQDAYRTGWVIGMRCRLHGASKAVEWGVNEFSNDYIRSAAQIAIKSLINTSYDIHRNAESYIFTSATFIDPVDSIADRRAFWVCEPRTVL